MLRDALTWTLPDASWDQIHDAIEEISTAVAAVGPDELWRTAGNLELHSPLRVMTRLGEPPVLAVPREIRERIVELIDVLTSAEELADITDRTQQDVW